MRETRNDEVRKEECPVCAGCTTSLRRCPRCEFGSCSRCMRRYLLSLQGEAGCMNCHLHFTRRTLIGMTSRSFVDGAMAKRRETLLFEREVSQMASTQPVVDAVLRERRDRERVEELRRQIGILTQEIATLESRREDVHSLLKKGASFVARCSTEGCMGHLSRLSSTPPSLKCEICQKRTCPLCHSTMGDEHVCDQSVVETIHLLRTDSRRCPSCSVVIHRYTGCDQVFCVRCNTSFSYRTGREIQGPVHNPHYFEWLDRNREEGVPRLRDPADIPCGGRPTVAEMTNIACGTFEVQRFLYAAYRLIVHLDVVERPRYATVEEDHLSLRVSFMIGDVDEKTFRRRVAGRERAEERKREIGLVLDTVIQASDDLFRQMVISGVADEHLKTVKSLFGYFNASMIEVGKEQGCLVPLIGEDLNPVWGGQIQTKTTRMPTSKIADRSLTAKGQIRQVMEGRASKTASGLKKSDILVRRKNGTKRYVSKKKSKQAKKQYNSPNSDQRKWNELLPEAWKEVRGTKYPGPGPAVKGKWDNPVYSLAKKRLEAWQSKKRKKTKKTSRKR